MSMASASVRTAVGGKEGAGGGGSEKVSRKDFEDPDPNTFVRAVKRKLVVEGKEEELPVGVFFKFRVIPPPKRSNGEARPLCLAKMIRSAGGELCSSEADGDYALTVLDLWSLEKKPLPSLEVPNDTYSSLFIYHSIRNKKLKLPPPDPSKHLLTPSIYSPYDPLRILLRKTKWSDLTVLGEPRTYPAGEIMAKLHQKARSASSAEAEQGPQVTVPPPSNANEEAVGPSDPSMPSTSQGIAGAASPSPKHGSKVASCNSKVKSPPQNRILSASFARTRSSTKLPDTSKKDASQPQRPPSREKRRPTGRRENGNDHPSGINSSGHSSSKRSRRVSSPQNRVQDVSENSAAENVSPRHPPSHDKAASPENHIDEVGGNRSEDISDPAEASDNRSKEASDQNDSDDSDVDHVPASKETPNTRSEGEDISDDSEATDNSSESLVLPSKDKVRLAPSPKNPNRVVIRKPPVPVPMKPPVLVPLAFAGPSTRRSDRKQVKPRNRPEATKGDQWVDGGVQDSVLDVVESDAGSDNESGSSVSYNSDDLNLANKREAIKKKKAPVARRPPRSPYKSYEDNLIVKKICDQGAIPYTKGRRLWVLLAESEEFYGKRTYGSLQNRWKRSIVPRLLKQDNSKGKGAFKISDAHLDRIKRLQKEHHNHDKICPNFDF